MLTAVLLVGLVGCAPVPDPVAGPPMPHMTPVAVTGPARGVAGEDCGCGDDPAAALEAAVKEAQPATAAAMRASPGVYSDVQIRAVPPDTLEYVYVFAHQLSAAEATPYFDSQMSQLQDLCDTQAFPAMVRMGIESPKARFTFFNADGSTLWSHTFEPSA